MNEIDFKFFQKLLLEKSGLHLTADKTYLLETRLSPLGKTLGFESLSDFVKHLSQAPNSSDIKAVIEAMTTNETSFFRDTKPFQHFKKAILPALVERRKDNKRINIWSAAASTGQESYSIAMTLHEQKEILKDYRVEIIGTDIDETVIKQAQEGIYNNFEIQRGLSMPMIVKNFDQKGDNWQIKPSLRQMVKFKIHNLLNNPQSLGPQDIIFCRNVLIYFNSYIKVKVLQNLYSLLPDDGFLFLGSCENIMSSATESVPIPHYHGVYIKRTSTKYYEDLLKAPPGADGMSMPISAA
jgi:chemotaxis protein methyltransferase CheR